MSENRESQDGHYELENSFGYLLNRAANMIAARFSDQLKSYDITLQAWRMLAALNESDGQSVSELANHTGAELSYLSRSVVSLEARHLVLSRQSATDKRTKSIVLTRAGQALVRKLAPQGREIERTSLLGASDADVEATLRSLRLVYTNLVGNQNATAGVNRKLTVARRVDGKGAPKATRERAVW